jgi:hypothetical protein
MYIGLFKFMQSNTEDYIVWYWNLYRLIMNSVLKFVQVGTEDYTELRRSLHILTPKVMQSNTDVNTGW